MRLFKNRAAAPQPLGPLEVTVMEILWTHGENNVRDVVDRLGRPLAYTTVMTTLTRLHDKGALTRELSGRAYAYRLTGDRAEVGASVTAHRMRRLLDAGEDRAGVLARFVATLSPSDERLLADLLAEGHRREDPL